MSATAARLLRVARIRGTCTCPTVEFNAAMRLQELLRDRRHSASVVADDPGDHLLLLQHSPVSLSAAGKRAGHAALSAERCSRDATLCRCIRWAGAQRLRRGG